MQKTSKEKYIKIKNANKKKQNNYFVVSRLRMKSKYVKYQER